MANAETLRLTHTLGRRGWTAAHVGAPMAFVLAAAGQALTRPSAFDPALLWRLFRLWRGGLARLDPAALRLALATDARVRLSGLALAFEFAAGTQARRIELPLARLRGDAARLPPPAAPLAWLAFGLTAAGQAAWAGLAQASTRLAPGTRLTIEAAALRSEAPPALRSALPLRIDLRVAAGERDLTLVPARVLALQED